MGIFSGLKNLGLGDMEGSDLFAEEEKTEQAAAMLREAIEVNPDVPRYHLVLGDIFRDVDNYKDALTEYQKVEDVYHHAEMYFGMGVCHQSKKEWTEAIRYFEKAIEKDARYRDTNLRLYRCYRARYWIEYRKTDYEKSLFYINKQMEIKEDGYCLWYRGNIYIDAMDSHVHS